MTIYEIYGRRLGSEIALPELMPATGPADLTFRCAPLGDVDDDDWFDIWPMGDGRPWIGAKSVASGYRIRYNDRAVFLIDRDHRTITCDPSDCPEDMMRHFLIDQVVPLTLSLETIVLHASSAMVGGRFAAFVGPGSAGKSTMAIGLGRLGHPIGSDDGLLLRVASEEEGSILATPSYPGVRLFPDSAAALTGGRLVNLGVPDAAKLRFRDGLPLVREAAALACLYVMDPAPASAIRFEPLTERAELMALVEQAYRLALDDRTALARQLDALATVARRVPAWRLSFPRALDAWRQLSHAVVDHLGRGAAVIA